MRKAVFKWDIFICFLEKIELKSQQKSFRNKVNAS